MSVLFYLFYSLPLKLPNNWMSFPFPSLKLPKQGKRMEEYSKIIIFIYFYSIPFSPPKWDLKLPQGKWTFLSLHLNSQTREVKDILKLFFSFFSILFHSPPPKQRLSYKPKNGILQSTDTKMMLYPVSIS